MDIISFKISYTFLCVKMRRNLTVSELANRMERDIS